MKTKPQLVRTCPLDWTQRDNDNIIIPQASDRGITSPTFDLKQNIAAGDDRMARVHNPLADRLSVAVTTIA